jgi:hypothetical protein
MWFMRRPKPKPKPPTEVNLNLNIGGGLTVQFVHPEPPPPSPIRCVVTARFDGFTMKGDAPVVYKLPDDKQINVQVQYLDSKGRPAQVDGDVVWATSDETIVAVTVSPNDSTQAQIAPAGQDLLGQVQISATADADIGEGVNHVVCTLDVELIGGEAVIGQITPVGDPQPYVDPNDPHQGVPPSAVGPQSRARK